MASLEYGMYGYNVINPNGETSQRVICRLVGTGVTASAGGVAYGRYSTFISDDYRMAVPNIDGTYTAIRTPVAGIYRVTLSQQFSLTAAGGRVICYIGASKDPTFDASGFFVPTATGAVIGGEAVGSTSGFGSVYCSDEIFLDRDTYICSVFGPVGANMGAVSTTDANYGLTVTLISAENSPKQPNVP